MGAQEGGHVVVEAGLKARWHHYVTVLCVTTCTCPPNSNLPTLGSAHCSFFGQFPPVQTLQGHFSGYTSYTNMLASHIKVDTMMGIGLAIQGIVYNIIETTCTVILFTVIAIHLCYYIHTGYSGDNESDSEARNSESNQLVATSNSTPLASSVYSDSHCTSSLAVSRISDDKNSTLVRTCPLPRSYSPLEAGTEPFLVNVNGPHVTKLAGSVVPLRLSTFTPFLVSSVDPPTEGSESSTDRSQDAVAIATPPPTDVTPVRRLKTASVDFVLLLAWKVISQKCSVPRSRHRLRPARSFPQRIVRQHLRYNAKIVGTTLQSRRYRSPCVSPVLDLLPALPRMSSPEIRHLDVSSSSVESPGSTPVLLSGCGPTRYQDPRSRPRALTRGKQLYGARKIKSARPQPDCVSRSRPFSSSASAEFVTVDVCFNKVGEAVAVQRQEMFLRRMLAVANVRFSAPVA